MIFGASFLDSVVFLGTFDPLGFFSTGFCCFGSCFAPTSFFQALFLLNCVISSWISFFWMGFSRLVARRSLRSEGAADLEMHRNTGPRPIGGFSTGEPPRSPCPTASHAVVPHVNALIACHGGVGPPPWRIPTTMVAAVRADLPPCTLTGRPRPSCPPRAFHSGVPPLFASWHATLRCER